MTKAILTFKIMSYWHAGTGMGEGANLDAVVTRTANGLPYLPGKTVKGLFREAILIGLECNHLASKTILSFLGAHRNRFDSDMSCLKFSNATLGENMETWAAVNKDKCCHFFRRISSTRINKNGQAQNDMLRTIEVAIPLTLTAFVESNSLSKDWIKDFEKAAPFVRYVGMHRHRGLGRTAVKVEEVTT